MKGGISWAGHERRAADFLYPVCGKKKLPAKDHDEGRLRAVYTGFLKNSIPSGRPRGWLFPENRVGEKSFGITFAFQFKRHFTHTKRSPDFQCRGIRGRGKKRIFGVYSGGK
jgi:hypothetical protein